MTLSLRPGWKEAGRGGWEKEKEELCGVRKSTGSGLKREHGRDAGTDAGKAIKHAELLLCAEPSAGGTYNTVTFHPDSSGSVPVPFTDGEGGY